MHENNSFAPDDCQMRKSGLVCVAAGLFAVLIVPFLTKPVHIDDANFLLLAEGAARDLWRPHSIQINWLGHLEPAFDVLSNPPGIAWWLTPVRHAPEWVMHTWMLCWLPLAIWGCRQLARVFVGDDGMGTVAFLLTAPVVVLSAQALTPDFPLFACATAGIGGFMNSRKSCWIWALVAGCGFLFRYSAALLVPLLMIAGWRRRGVRGLIEGAIAGVPGLLLVLHDLHAYGHIHVLKMVAFQNDGSRKSPTDAFDNLAAGIAMLGGAGVLPLLIWRRESLIGACAGAWMGINVAFLSNQPLTPAIYTVVFCASGMAALSLLVARRTGDRILFLWAAGGCLLFLITRFAAARYWIPFLPAVGLAALRNSSSRIYVAAAVAINVLVSLGMAIDDFEFANCQRDAALRVSRMGTGTFSGHWGWQHYLEKAGWTAVERGGEIGEIHAVSRMADPQSYDTNICTDAILHLVADDVWWGPRVHSSATRAAYHAGGKGAYSPWTFSSEPYDQITVYRRCPK